MTLLGKAGSRSWASINEVAFGYHIETLSIVF